jgi:hypothetical protein
LLNRQYTLEGLSYLRIARLTATEFRIFVTNE